MIIRTERVRVEFWAILLATWAFSACNITGNPVYRSFRLPNVPSGLESIENGVYWKILTSGNGEYEAPSGGMVQINGLANGVGEWLLASPHLRPGFVESFSGDLGMPCLGWVSGAEMGQLTPGAGILAKILASVEKGQGIWAGLNIPRFLGLTQKLGLDTVNANLPVLAQAVMLRDLSVDDFSLRESAKLDVVLPWGLWYDVYGVKVADIRSEATILNIILFAGVNNLFRQEDGAVLRLAMTLEPSGSRVVHSVLHRTSSSQPSDASRLLTSSSAENDIDDPIGD